MPPAPEQLSQTQISTTQLSSNPLHHTIEALYRSESGRVLATLVGLLEDLDLAEEAMHEAFAAALESWPQTGVPDKPRPWLISTARFKAIDRMRRRARFDATQKDLTLHTEARLSDASFGIETIDAEKIDDTEIEDDRLRLIFTCCHPALPPEGQVALTLREICGLTTEEIARAFLVAPATLAQRIVRAKTVIRDKAIPYQVPVSAELPGRLGAVLLVIYLIFNEGYSAETTGAELSREAIRLGRLLLDLLNKDSLKKDLLQKSQITSFKKAQPEVMGLLGLMLLQESRRAARTSADGDLILLDQQDRSLWNKDQIAEGIALTESALRPHRFGAYTLQAAIAAVHAGSPSAASTDWRQITLLYDQLLRIQPSPVVELNRAVAVAMCGGTRGGTHEDTPGRREQAARQALEQGLRLIDDLLTRKDGAREELSNYYLAHSARADLCRRLGRIPEARASYEKALALLAPGKDKGRQEKDRKDNDRPDNDRPENDRREKDRHEPDRRFLRRRLEELGSGSI